MENSTLRTQSTISSGSKITRFPEVSKQNHQAIPSRPVIVALVLACSDFIVLLGILIIGQSRHAPTGQVIEVSDLSLLTIVVTTLIFSLAMLGQYSRRIPFWEQTKSLLKRILFFSMASYILSDFVLDAGFAPITMLYWVAAIPCILALRKLSQLALTVFGLWKKPTVIIGTGNNAIETANAITADKYMGYEIVNFLTTESEQSQKEIPNTLSIDGKNIPVRRISVSTEKTLRRLGSPHVIVALEKGGIDKIQSHIDHLILEYPNLSVSPALRKLPLFSAQTHRFFSHEIMLLEFNNNLNRATSKILKRAFDIAGSLALIATLSPAILAITLLIRKTGKSVIFAHKRVGRNGESFNCYKFRSMVENSDEVLQNLLSTSDEARREWYRDFKLKNDPRITPFGRFLRRSSLDELPQLWNVLKGEMSLVGPRPVITDEIPQYGNYVNFYYKASPGLTGLWQVSGRNDIDYKSRVELDVWYVSNWSLWNDIVILIKTVKVVLSKSGAY